MTKAQGRPSDELREWCHDLSYQADSWANPRRVVLVVQEYVCSAEQLLDLYRKRGKAEAHMGELKSTLDLHLPSTNRGASTVQQQDRACYLINFSTGIETLDLSGEIGMEQVIRFLQLSFNGGTDAVPALEYGLEMMQQEDYEKADLLMISDFVMGGLPQNIMQKIDQQRVQGNQFNSLVIDSGYSARQTSTQFDNEWIYDPATQSVRELVNTQLEMTDPQYVL